MPNFAEKWGKTMINPVNVMPAFVKYYAILAQFGFLFSVPYYRKSWQV